MSVVERIGRQILPLLLLIPGMGYLGYSLWINTSYYHGSSNALAFCGILAPLVQMIGTLASPKLSRKVLRVSVDVAVILLSFAVIRLGMYVTYDLLHIPMVKYAYYPGWQIEAVAACVAAVVVAALAFSPRTRVKASSAAVYVPETVH